MVLYQSIINFKPSFPVPSFSSVWWGSRSSRPRMDQRSECVCCTSAAENTQDSLAWSASTTRLKEIQRGQFENRKWWALTLCRVLCRLVRRIFLISSSRALESCGSARSWRGFLGWIFLENIGDKKLKLSIREQRLPKHKFQRFYTHSINSTLHTF